MNDNRYEDFELTENEKVKFDRLQEMIKALYAAKKISQDDLLEAMMNDEEMQQILLSRKYIFSNGKVYPLNPRIISSSLVQADLSDDELKESVLRLDGNYKIVYEKNKAEKIKNTLKQRFSMLKYCVLLPFNLILDLYDRFVDLLLDQFDIEFTRVAVHESRESILKIRSGEEQKINCDDLDVKALLREYSQFDTELKSIPTIFSKALEYHMNYRGISGAQLADITGIAASTISKMINEDSEEAPNHKLKSIVAICIALKLPPVMSYNLIDLAGCRLLNNRKDRIYTMLLNYFYDRDIEYCDTVLEKLGVKGLKIY